MSSPQNKKSKNDKPTRWARSIIDWLWGVVRSTWRVDFWGAILLFAFAVKVVVIVVNYMGVQAGLEFLKWENKPLKADAILGPFAHAIFGDASLGVAFAAVLAVMAAGLIFLVTHLVFGLIGKIREWRGRLEAARRLWEDAERAERRNHLGEADHLRDEARQMSDRAVNSRWAALRAGIYTAVLGVLTYWVVLFDMQLFRFRSLLRVKDVHKPEGVPLDVTGWTQHMQQSGDLFNWLLIDEGAWAYIGLTAAAAIGIEFGMYQVGRAFESLVEAIKPGREESPGTLAGARSATAAAPRNRQNLRQSGVTRPNAGNQLGLPQTGHGVNGTAVNGRAVYEPDRNGQVSNGAAKSEKKEVIGGGGESVTLQEARANPDDYHVCSRTGEVWNRERWRQANDVW